MRNIRIFFKNIYKYWIRSFFKVLYGHISYNIENIPDPNLIIKKVKNKYLINSKNNNYHIYNVVGGKIYTDYVENVAIINKQKIVNEASFQQVDGKLKNAELHPSYNMVSLLEIPLDSSIPPLDEKLPASKKTQESRFVSEPSAIASLIW